MIVSASFVEHVFVSFTAFFVMMECALTIMQTHAAEKGIHKIPEGFEKKTTLLSIRKAADYTGDLAQASLLLTILGALFALGMTYGQGLTVIAAFTTTLFGPGLAAQWALVIIVLLLMSLIEFPFGWWARFRVKESYGYMREPRLAWFRRTLSETGTGLLYVLPLTALLISLFELIGRYWWCAVIVLWIAFLFWRWYLTRAESIFWNRRARPFKSFTIKAYIRAHLKAAGYDMQDIVVMTRPKHWSHSNVMLAGYRKKVTVVVFAHAAQVLSPEELLAAVMHEMGHLKGHHAEIRITLFAILGSLAAAIVGQASATAEFFQGFGFSTYLLSETPGVHAGYTLSLAILTFPIFYYPFQPFANFLARSMQYSADRYAARVVGPDAVIRFILQLHKDRSQTLFPSALYTLFHYERPRAGMRVEKLNQFKKDWVLLQLQPQAPLWVDPPKKETASVSPQEASTADDSFLNDIAIEENH